VTRWRTLRAKIESIDEDEVERALPRADHEAVEFRPPIARATYAPVDKLGDDPEPAPRGILAQHVELHLRILADERRDAGVDRGACGHAPSSSAGTARSG